MQRRADLIEAGERELAVDHRLVRERAAGAAVFLRNPRAQQAGLAELVPGGTVHDAVLVPALDLRHQLVGHEAPCLLLEQDQVLGHPGRAGNVEGVHGVLTRARDRDADG